MLLIAFVLAVFGSLCLRGTARPSVVLTKCHFPAAVTARLYRSNAEDASRIRAMVLSDDVSDDESTDDETESDGDYVEPREGDMESE